MTHRLYLLRHAKSDWNDSALADHERPLAPRGHRACELVQKHLAVAGVDPDVILCSTATRARQTLEGVVAGFSRQPAIWHEQRLYGAGAGELLGVLQELPGEFRSAMVVGHNPGIQSLAESLAAEGADLERLRAKYPTAGLATLGFAGEWLRLRSGGAVLEGFVIPRELEASG